MRTPLKTNNRETHESSSTLTLAMLATLAISVIIGIAAILLTMDSIRKEEQMQALGRMPPILIEPEKKPAADFPAGGPYIPSSGKRPTSNPLDSVDRVLDSMVWANIAFNAPLKISLTDKAQIQLLLSIQKSMDELRGLIVAAGQQEGAIIKVTNQMEARLTGQEGSFKILKITPEEQAVGSVGTFEWKWEVEPLIPGVHTLYLGLIAHFTVDGVPTRKSIRTFERKINVEVSAGQLASQFYERNWQWLWAAILIPTVGWLWKLWNGWRVGRKKRKPA